MGYIFSYLFGAVVVITMSWLVLASVRSLTLRVFLRTGIIAILAAPTFISDGHGLYLGPAIVPCFLGIDWAMFLQYCLPPMLVGWLLMFVVGWIWTQGVALHAREAAAEKANEA